MQAQILYAHVSVMELCYILYVIYQNNMTHLWTAQAWINTVETLILEEYTNVPISSFQSQDLSCMNDVHSNLSY